MELDDLFAQLASAQQQKTKARLSERNVIELVSKLTELGFLEPGELVHTSNGREYLTRERLRKEVHDAVVSSSSSSVAGGVGGAGRLPVVDLPGVLGVDLVHCERAAREAVAESQSEGNDRDSRDKRDRLQFVSGESEIVSDSYLDSLVGEVEELLSGGGGSGRGDGLVSLADLCSRFGLGASVVGRVLESATAPTPLGPPRLRARLDGGFLVTERAAARARAKLRGALRGVSAPSQLSTLASSVGVDPRVLPSTDSGGGGGLAATVEAMVRAGELRGALGGGGGGGSGPCSSSAPSSSFVPEIHSKASAAASAAFYASNGYLELGGPSRQRPAPLPEGAVVLSSAVAASPALVAQVDAAVEDASASALSSSSPFWTDVSSQGVIPAAFTREEARALLGKSPAAEKLRAATAAAEATASTATAEATPQPSPPAAALLLSGTCVVSGSLLSGAREKAIELALEAAALSVEEQKRRRRGTNAPAAPPPPPAASFTSSGSSKASKGAFDDDDDWSTGGKKKKGGGGKRKGAAPKNSTTATTSAAPPSASDALSLSNLAEAIERWFPGTGEAGIGDGGSGAAGTEEEGDEDGGDGGSLSRSLARLVRPPALSAFDAAVSEALAESASGEPSTRGRRRAREAALAASASAAERLQLYSRGAEGLLSLAERRGSSSPSSSLSPAEAFDAISRHLLLRGPGAEAADALLRVLASDAAADAGGGEVMNNSGEGGESPFAELPADVSPASLSLTQAERNALVATLPSGGPSSCRSVARALVDALSCPPSTASTDLVPSFLSALDEATTRGAGARAPAKLERKAEKALASAARSSLVRALREEKDAAAALPLAASALLAELKPGRAVPPVPGRALGFLLDALASALSAASERRGAGAEDESSRPEEETVALFGRYHSLVVSSLRRDGGGDKEAASRELEELLPRLKRSALGEGEEGGGGGGEGEN